MHKSTILVGNKKWIIENILFFLVMKFEVWGLLPPGSYPNDEIPK
jgi:hypothetical protein